MINGLVRVVMGLLLFGVEIGYEGQNFEKTAEQEVMKIEEHKNRSHGNSRTNVTKPQSNRQRM